VKKEAMRDETTMDESALPAGDVGEQLSALLDGELPEAQARFLQRRLAHDAALRAKWARMQVGASCLRNQPWQPMAADLPARIAAALDAEPAAPRRGRRVLGWAVAASVAAFALAFAPRFATSPDAPPAVVAQVAPSAATLAAADLVGSRDAARSADVAAAAPADAVDATVARSDGTLLARTDAARPPAGESPMPQTADSPADFPLVATGDKHWPRSQLAGADAPALEALLVRHNQMIANDGLSGFVPYVDVVSTDPGSADGIAPADAPAESPAQ
jgi:negative regulator of sigma E activity